ncbi:MAG: hypothetical protein E7568_00585 [Ruminococcaceae bacterium]|nr:hypothetical protein [Oscillospiraceae bacterium]
MDINKWNKYEEKKKELKKSYRGKFATVWIVWAFVCAALIAVIAILSDKIDISITIIGIVLVLGFSLMVALNKTGEYIKAIKQQELLLEQEEPFGKFRD